MFSIDFTSGCAQARSQAAPASVDSMTTISPAFPVWLPRLFREIHMPATLRRRPPALLALLLAIVALAATIPPAQAEFGLSDAGRQIRIGVLHHDLNGYGGSEDSKDVTVELRCAPLSGAVWQTLLSPRPHIGANINNSGDTSSLYADFTWMVDFGRNFYASADFGGAVHNGKLETNEPNRAALGSRLLFREALELGVRLGDDWRIGIRIDHISNGDLAAENDGITNLGVVLSRQL